MQRPTQKCVGLLYFTGIGLLERRFYHDPAVSIGHHVRVDGASGESAVVIGANIEVHDDALLHWRGTGDEHRRPIALHRDSGASLHGADTVKPEDEGLARL